MDTLEKKMKVKELWQLCFHDDERFVNLLFDNLYRDENTVCFEKGGEVTTALQMLPYRMSFGETSLDVSYISGAATRPEYRNRGLMGRLLKADGNDNPLSPHSKPSYGVRAQLLCLFQPLFRTDVQGQRLHR